MQSFLRILFLLAIHGVVVAQPKAPTCSWCSMTQPKHPAEYIKYDAWEKIKANNKTDSAGRKQGFWEIELPNYTKLVSLDCKSDKWKTDQELAICSLPWMAKGYYKNGIQTGTWLIYREGGGDNDKFYCLFNHGICVREVYYVPTENEYAFMYLNATKDSILFGNPLDFSFYVCLEKKQINLWDFFATPDSVHMELRKRVVVHAPNFYQLIYTTGPLQSLLKSVLYQQNGDTLIITTYHSDETGTRETYCKNALLFREKQNNRQAAWIREE